MQLVFRHGGLLPNDGKQELHNAKKQEDGKCKDALKESKTVHLEKKISYKESGSGSINGVAPNGSMFASNILLIIELPAMEAARPALKPD